MPCMGLWFEVAVQGFYLVGLQPTTNEKSARKLQRRDITTILITVSYTWEQNDNEDSTVTDTERSMRCFWSKRHEHIQLLSISSTPHPPSS